MGLDQYLSARKFVSGSEYSSEADRNAYRGIVGAVNADSFSEIYNGFGESATLSLSVAYWRKANQVHQWFVLNCGDGEDNCQQMYVSREQLGELLETCKSVKAGGEKVADELLPPQSGFFFGSTDIDDWYWQDIDNTIEQLEEVLSTVPEGWDFEYQASW